MTRGGRTTAARIRRIGAVLALSVSSGLLSSPTPAAADCGPGVSAGLRNGRVVCAHPDEAPPGIDLDRRPTADELAERRFGAAKQPMRAPYSAAGTTVVAAANSIACVGDGTDGTRVQAIYARASDVTDRYGSVASLLAQYAADSDYEINVSAGLSGEGRRIRYVTKNCQLDIARATLSPSGDNSFYATVNELRSQGFNRSDRKYLVWVDAAVGICGIAELYGDDRASASNWNNSGNMYARVDAPCWGYAETHEMLHSFGAVQDSAAHSTNAGHCFDENDTMCYSDGSGVPMISACPSLPSWHVDCNLDDYFNAAPADGSYLATHWNAAGSIYLSGSDPLPPSPSIALSAPPAFYAGTLIGVSASVSVPAGRTFTVGWTTTLAGCKFTSATGLKNVFYCPATMTGSGQITATIVDSLGMKASASKTFKLKIPSKRRATITKLYRSGHTLKAAVVDAVTGKPVVGMRVTVYYRRAGSSTWKKSATRSTGVSGTFTFTVSPPKTSYYRLISKTNATWAYDKSPSKKIPV